MNNLSPHQYMLIRKTKRLPVVLDEVGKTDRELYHQLCENGLIVDNGGLLFITETGRAVLSARFRSTVGLWLPIIISIASFIVSILAFLKA